jgi:hypothetical protein
MSFIISTKAELIKTKRSASFWLSMIGAAVIPVIFFLIYVLEPEKNYAKFEQKPWEMHFVQGWQAFAIFLLPMFVILICSLIPQIEFKNNTWKQVFASPQSTGNIFFSKYLSIIIMILFLFLMFNILMLISGSTADLFYSKYTFLDKQVDWFTVFKVNLKVFISLLAIISMQYWLGLRFKNFIVPIGIGLGLLVTSMILMPWQHSNKLPYGLPFQAFLSMSKNKGETDISVFGKQELYSIGYFAFFTLVAFLDLRFRKERG